MTRPWWGKDADASAKPKLRSGGAGSPPRPAVFETEARPLAEEIRGRVRAFTPSWTSHRKHDAGEVLIDLFAAQASLVARDLDQLPRKAQVELLRSADVTPLAASPVRTVVSLEVSPNAPGSVLVPRGLQVGARPAGGGDLIVLETERDAFASPATIKALLVQEGDLFERLTVPGPDDKAVLSPLGARPRPGNALWLGLESTVSLAPQITIGFFMAPRDGAARPVSQGSLVPASELAPPVLSWDLHDGRDLVPVEVVRDETQSLTTSGVVQLQVPHRWDATLAPGAEGDVPLRWLRVRLLFGTYDSPPALAFVLLNCVPALAGETVRDEVLEPVPEPGTSRKSVRLERRPIAARSLVLEVDDGSGAPRAWTEVEDLSSAREDEEIFVVDPAAGVATFGDGVHGRPLPEGFRHVRAVRYRTLPPSPPIDAGSVTTLIGSSPFLVAVSNPLPGAGGGEPETFATTLRRGPREIRARGRAVTPADFELCALHAPGADVRRAHALPGFHPGHAGLPIPGVVGVMVVPSDSGDGEPPSPDDGSLRGVAEFLAREAALAGVEVVAMAPRYQRVRLELGPVVSRRGDLGEIVAQLLTEVNAYLHPLTGGDAGEGWPFGGAIRWVPLVRHLLQRLSGRVLAIPRLNVVLDGVRTLGCQDRAIEPHALLWPEAHEVVPIVEDS